MRKLILSIKALGALLLVLGVASQAMAASSELPRFVDNGNGTITDTLTGLMWEKKTIGSGPVTDVDLFYTWSRTGTVANGTLFTDFLARMNCTISSNRTCGPGPYSDWRIPTLAELRTILSGEFPFCVSPCIDAIFGPTQEASYWSSTTYDVNPGSAWRVSFGDGAVLTSNKLNPRFARAVRGGR